MFYCPKDMHRPKFASVLCLCFALFSCKRPDPIRLQPTIEEAAGPATVVQMSDPATAAQLVGGFYALEGNSWRWSARRFSVAVGAPARAGRNGAQVVLKFNVPPPALQAMKEVTVDARIGPVDLGPQTFRTSGDHEYRRPVPASAFEKDAVQVDFALDKGFRPPNEQRELGVVVHSITLEPK